MLSTDMFIVTPFYREQIELTGNITEQPDIPFTSYAVYVFRTRLEAFMIEYFNNRKKYNYNTFVFKDIPSEGKMITTLEILDKNQNKIQLTKQEIIDINLEIAQITTLYPSYFLFFSDKEYIYPQAWLNTILPSFQFERTTYYPEDSSKTFKIPSIYDNGKLYLDLSQDLNFSSTVQKLYSTLNEQLDTYFYSGTIPEMIEISAAEIKRVPGKFIQFKDKTGEEVLDELAELPSVTIPKTDELFLSEVKVKSNKNETTVFVLNFTRTNPDMNIFIDPIGAEFLVSLRNFLKADDVLIQEHSQGYYEIELKQDGKFIQSNLNIKDMFGYFYFTDHPMGLLVAEDMQILEDSKIIYDSISGRGGLFIPMIHLDEPVEKDLMNIQLDNRMKHADVFTKTPEMELILTKLKVNIISSIDNYFYVSKNDLITKRIVYRALQNYPPQILLTGPWNFEKVPSDIVIQFAKEFTKTDNIREGPFSTIIVPVESLPYTKELQKFLEEKLYIQYHPARKF